MKLPINLLKRVGSFSVSQPKIILTIKTIQLVVKVYKQIKKNKSIL